jgi:putative transcriptional regulator
MTQRELARRAGLREATVSEMCNNVIIRLNKHHLDAVCRALDCKLSDLLEYVPDEEV